MHKQRIAHLDIHSSNILANHVTNKPRTPFLRSFDFRLAYIDFEFSVRVPRENPLVDVRALPPTYLGLPEVKARNSHVDPFAADVRANGRLVGVLGHMLTSEIRCTRLGDRSSTT